MHQIIQFFENKLDIRNTILTVDKIVKGSSKFYEEKSDFF